MKSFLVAVIGSWLLISNTYAQNEFQVLGKKIGEEYYKDPQFQAISRKIPLAAKNATLQQLADESRPNAQEKLALIKYVELRKREWDQLKPLFLNVPTKSPAGYIEAYVGIMQATRNKESSLLAELYNGKITFGEFNRKRQQYNAEEDLLQAEALSSFKKNAESRTVERAAQTSVPRPISIVGQALVPSDDATVYLYDSPCTIPRFASQYPLSWEGRSNTSNPIPNSGGRTRLPGCYSYDRQTGNVTMVLRDGNGPPEVLPLSDFQTTNNAGGFWSNFANIVGAITAGANSAYQTANPPNSQTSTPVPGIVQGRPYTPRNQPNFSSSQSKSANCTTIFNGGVASTSCY